MTVWLITGMLIIGASLPPDLVHPSVPFPALSQCQMTVAASAKEWAGAGATLIALCLPRQVKD